METNWDEIEQDLRKLDKGFDRIISKLDEIQEKINLLKQAITEENGN
jgi:peptidoglycan hydrolase CwlO-like protein